VWPSAAPNRVRDDSFRDFGRGGEDVKQRLGKMTGGMGGWSQERCRSEEPALEAAIAAVRSLLGGAMDTRNCS